MNLLFYIISYFKNLTWYFDALEHWRPLLTGGWSFPKPSPLRGNHWWPVRFAKFHGFFFSFSALWTRKIVLSRSLESLCRNFSRRSCSLFEITGGQLCFLGIIIKCTITLWRKQILNHIGWLTSHFGAFPLHGTVRFGTVRLSSGRLHFHCSLVPL